MKHDNLFLSKWADVFGVAALKRVVWILLDSTSQRTYFGKKIYVAKVSTHVPKWIEQVGGGGLSERRSCFVKPAQLRLRVWTKPCLFVVGSKAAK